MNQTIDRVQASWHVIVNIAGNSTILGLLASGIVPNPYAFYLAIGFNAIHVIVAFLENPTGGLVKTSDSIPPAAK
jgi:hypothetical protein